LAAAGESPLLEPTRVAELARRPGLALVPLLAAAGQAVEAEEAEWANLELKYGGYLARERERAARLRRMETVALPADVDYATLLALSFEAREKLAVHRPATLGQAARVPGVSPSDIQALAFVVMRAGKAPVSRETG
jgi:tRNA uridine 5-carboxymethylaminomethyl modification enzyme